MARPDLKGRWSKEYMLHRFAQNVKLLARRPAASQQDLKSLQNRFAHVPEEYLTLMEQATEIELSVAGRYLRIWAPDGCIEHDEGYGISQRIPGAIPIGDNGGGRVLFYWNGPHGQGLYGAAYGDLDPDDSRWVARSLESVLCEGTPVEGFCECDA